MFADGDHLLRKRATSNNNENNLDITTIVIIVVLTFGGYLTFISAVVGTLIFCFVRFNCQCEQCCGLSCCYRATCAPKCVRKARISCPKAVEDNVSKCCATMVRSCCPCCSNVDDWDSEELGFWIEIVILAICCFPFALCCLVLYAYSTK